ncbi:LysR family transcriptional regulator [Paenibacillus cellulositrophicus]|uniref:LysR family transcriptional regulator n=1 Tax=Paenibacillus cellulositrophicus TaxID=562959 RepID=UPI0020409273|nr:LysR family transcriptional regulator [Paenibacillus cellulositrophicus]MCM3000054.1 LysR family transcriptional regulator [Paenibacillus cellulositrophicus]
MESGDLRIFRAVAEEGSITRAAQRLQYVPSNVTGRIRQLEEGLQTPLFIRSNRGMELTPAGERLLGYARQILNLLDEAEKSVQAEDAPRGPLRIGAIESAAAAHLPGRLAAYYARYPHVSLSLATGNSRVLMQQVLDRELEGAFVYGPVPHSQLEQIPSYDEELVLLSEAGAASLQEQLQKPMLILSTGCTHRSRVERLLAEAGVQHPQIMEFGSLEAVLGGVASGLGVALLPRSNTVQIPNEKNIEALTLPESYREVVVYFIYRRDVPLSSALRAFLEPEKYTGPSA